MKTLAPLVILIIMLVTAFPAGAAIASGVDSTNSSFTESVPIPGHGAITMKPLRDGFSASILVPVDDTEVVFRKEPDYAGKYIVRGVIPVGREKKDRICFACDLDDEKIYVDLNRNLDLTDDPTAYSVVNLSDQLYKFNDITLPLTLDSGTVEYTVSVTLSKKRHGTMCFVIVASGWETLIKAGGKDWAFAVVDDLNGVIDGRDTFYLASADKLHKNNKLRYSGIRVKNMPDNLFFSGHEYGLSFAFSNSGDDSASLVMKLDELDTPMGTLRLSGKIDRMILTAQDDEISVALLDNPVGTIIIPARKYDNQEYSLGNGAVIAMREKALTIATGQRTDMKVGGPLDNTVQMKKIGPNLELNYALIGADSTVFNYRTLGFISNPPKFIIRKNGRKIASGTFRYG